MKGKEEVREGKKKGKEKGKKNKGKDLGKEGRKEEEGVISGQTVMVSVLTTWQYLK